MPVHIDSLDKLFSKYIRLRANGVCEYCGRVCNPKGYHTHHFIGRRYLNTRYQPDNGAALCFSCHNLVSDFPRINQEFLTKRVGSERADELELIARTYKKMTSERREQIKADLKERIKQFEQIR